MKEQLDPRGKQAKMVKISSKNVKIEYRDGNLRVARTCQILSHDSAHTTEVYLRCSAQPTMLAADGLLAQVFPVPSRRDCKTMTVPETVPGGSLGQLESGQMEDEVPENRAFRCTSLSVSLVMILCKLASPLLRDAVAMNAIRVEGSGFPGGTADSDSAEAGRLAGEGCSRVDLEENLEKGQVFLRLARFYSRDATNY